MYILHKIQVVYIGVIDVQMSALWGVVFEMSKKIYVESPFMNSKITAGFVGVDRVSSGKMETGCVECLLWRYLQTVEAFNPVLCF